jgi:hypothetical protein
MTISAELLGAWSERLCGLPAGGDAAAAVAALGLDGSLDHRFGHAALLPPPPGIREFRVVERDGGGVSYLDLDLTPGGLAPTRAELDARFGEGHELPRVHPFTPFPVAYHVEVPGAPFTCEVIARFHDEPSGGAVAGHVVLRRDHA